MFCVECGGEMHPVSTDFVQEFHGEDYVIHGVVHMECASCGELAFSPKASREISKTIFTMYAGRHKGMAPDEIRKLRHDSGLNQKEFESLLGVSSPTCSRWETGGVMPSETSSRLMRLLANFPLALAWMKTEYLGPEGAEVTSDDAGRCGVSTGLPAADDRPVVSSSSDEELRARYSDDPDGFGEYA